MTLGRSPGPKKGIVKRLLVRDILCSGCRACEAACVAVHEGHFGTATARIRVAKIESVGVDRPRVCQSCFPAPCVAECPTGALFQDETLGAVVLRPDHCITCPACGDACAHGMVFIHPATGLPLICDLCEGEPACVERCATGALRYQEQDGEEETTCTPDSVGVRVEK